MIVAEKWSGRMVLFVKTVVTIVLAIVGSTVAGLFIIGMMKVFSSVWDW
jgi:hypothetical protein